ncbi:hypothetical protein BDZ85DRAFT_135612 [Elsinoe ampelina]|uniref:BTB domain-containing protein n=1 Tax=Elsinoe ampelina TaxID=302913 RepID=A0A6A6G8S0_9PEZI|nr:hypothetical protein BDZ85DRAFT_135612 [Elsinoe ampelina]
MAAAKSTTADPTKDSFALTSAHWMGPTGSELLSSGVESDCIIKASNGKAYKLHLFILTKACPYFAKAFCGDFKEGGEKCLDWTEYEPDLVDATIAFIYGRAYDKLFPPKLDTTLSSYVRLYNFADFCQYMPLKDMSIKYLRDHAGSLTTPEPLVQMLQAIQELGPDDPALKDTAINCVKKNVVALRSLPLAQRQNMVRRTPLLGALLIDHLVVLGDGHSLARYVCTRCKSGFQIASAKSIRHCPACGYGYPGCFQKIV